MTNLSSFVKYHRKRLTITQEELAFKAGVGLRFIRELEQGKETLRLDKVNQVLSLFGYMVSAGKIGIDPYDIFWNYLNKGVEITMTDNTTKHGIIIKEISDRKDNKIIAWKFVPNKNAIKYQKEKDDKFIENLEHSMIKSIKEQ
jgi:y4mF family transcriptional regulator